MAIRYREPATRERGMAALRPLEERMGTGRLRRREQGISRRLNAKATAPEPQAPRPVGRIKWPWDISGVIGR